MNDKQISEKRLKYLKVFELKPSTWKSAYNKEEDNIRNIRSNSKRYLSIDSKRSHLFLKKYLRGIFELKPNNYIKKSDVIFKESNFSTDELDSIKSIFTIEIINNSNIKIIIMKDILLHIEKVGYNFYKTILNGINNNFTYLGKEVYYFDSFNHLVDYLNQI